MNDYRQNNKRIALCSISFVFIIIGVFISNSIASEGSAQVEAGYVYTDEEGNRAVNQETFNTYDGFALSLRDLSYPLSAKWRLTADLQNVTLDNRNLSASLFNQGRFTMNVRHNKYRRVYDFDGALESKRSSSALDLSLSATKRLKFFGGVSLINREGERSDGLSVTTDQTKVDYDHLSYNAGAQFNHRLGSAFLQYTHFEFDNKITVEQSRKAERIRSSASLYVPGYEWLLVSGGFDSRKDEVDLGNSEITTNLGWAGLKGYLPHHLSFDYQFSFARTDQTSLDKETDNVTNVISLGKTWSGTGGLRLGYENRIADDLTDRTESNGFLASGWITFRRRLKLRGSVSLRDQDVVDGATLVGDRSISRHKVTAQYKVKQLGTIELKWFGKISEHDPSPVIRDTVDNETFASRADYNGIVGAFNFNFSQYGMVTISYTYNQGKYENNSDHVNYEFSDHIFRGQFSPRTYRGFDLSANGFYYKSKRDQDTEKFQLGFRAVYVALQEY